MIVLITSQRASVLPFVRSAKHRTFTIAGWVASIALLAIACGGAAATPLPTPPLTATPTATPLTESACVWNWATESLPDLTDQFSAPFRRQPFPALR